MLSPDKRRRNQENLGTIIKNARSKTGHTQKSLADAIGIEYYTMISQLELGYISIPPALWRPLGIALKLDLEEWVLLCLSEVQPEVYSSLFGDASITEVKGALVELKRQRSLD